MVERVSEGPMQETPAFKEETVAVLHIGDVVAGTGAVEADMGRGGQV